MDNGYSKIEQYIQSNNGDLTKSSSTDNETQLNISIPISEGNSHKRKYKLMVYQNREDNYLLQPQTMEIKQSFKTEEEVITKLDYLIKSTSHLKGVTATEKSLLYAVKFLEGECTDCPTEENFIFGSMHYIVQFKNGSTSDVRAYPGVEKGKTRVAKTLISIDGSKVSLREATEYLTDISGIQDNSRIVVNNSIDRAPSQESKAPSIDTEGKSTSREMPDCFKKLDKLVNGSGALFTLKRPSTTTPIAEVKIPLNGWAEKYLVTYRTDKDHPRYSLIACREYKKDFSTEEDVAKEVYRLIKEKPQFRLFKVQPDLANVLQAIRLAGGNYSLLEPTESTKFIAKLNNKEVEFKGVKDGLWIEWQPTMTYPEGIKYILSFSKSKTQPKKVAQNNNTKEITTIKEAIKGRKEHTTEINRRCLKYGITGEFLQETAIPKYRWNGAKYVRVKVSGGTRIPGYVDVDSYLLKHPNGTQYYLYVDTEDSYYAIVPATTPGYILAVSTNQKSIIDAIK